ncbi:hypothetical protein N7524_006430 [Penicillium chrysogenum]|nr:hypothetical protein N7524_006430 [Penicillium chrysogenum]
MAGGDNGFSC